MRHTLRGEPFKEPRVGAALASRPDGGDEDADLTLVPVDVIFLSETLEDRFSSLEIVDEEKVFFNFNFFASPVG
jgi:hypothetical protein